MTSGNAARAAGLAIVGVAAAALSATLIFSTTRDAPPPALDATVNAAATADDRTAVLRDHLASGPARNVILFIGDGMGDSEITIARNYAVGAAGRLALDTLTFTGAYTTFAVQERQP